MTSARKSYTAMPPALMLATNLAKGLYDRAEIAKRITLRHPADYNPGIYAARSRSENSVHMRSFRRWARAEWEKCTVRAMKDQHVRLR